MFLGDRAVCEHWGIYRSSELSRFRHSRRKFKVCPLCGFENLATDDRFCSHTLLLVLYTPEDIAQVPTASVSPPLAPGNGGGDSIEQNVHGVNGCEPAEGGHGAAGPGGHFHGKCLCSPVGCSPNQRCEGFPNTLYDGNPSGAGVAPTLRQHLALVAEEHIEGYYANRRWVGGESVFVLPAKPGGKAEERASLKSSKADCGTKSRAAPLLWRRGRLGGRATLLQWKVSSTRQFLD